MIIVQLIGGLGNQLFQYSMARRIAYKNNATLKLDISSFDSYKLREYKLSHFNINAELAQFDEVGQIRRMKRKNAHSRFYNFLDNFKPYYKRSVIREQFFHFDPNILKVSNNVYLEGYWQSEKYFRDIEDIVRRELTFRNEPDIINKKMVREIMNKEAISIHIRRGDYISDPLINQIYGDCPMVYYNLAIKKISKAIEKPHFFVFSDDPLWARNNLKIDYPLTLVSHNHADKDYEDLRLMSLCQHHIIANSSFSWWAAWLCANKEKIVIAPKKWFNSAEHDTRDLIPNTWLRV
jgi:hypothetical protein